MGGFHCCIVACTASENSIGSRTATMAVPLSQSLTSGPTKYETGLHSTFLCMFVCVFAKGSMQVRSGLNQINESLCEGIAWSCSRVSWRECLQGSSTQKRGTLQNG